MQAKTKTLRKPSVKVIQNTINAEPAITIKNLNADLSRKGYMPIGVTEMKRVKALKGKTENNQIPRGKNGGARKGSGRKV
jgi:hypothetical protein